MKKSLKVAALISTLVVAGCNSSLTCNDSEAKEQVLAIIDSHLVNDVFYQMIKSDHGNRKISGITTTEENNDRGQYSCSATYSFDYKEKTREIPFTYKLKFLEDKKESAVLVDVNAIRGGYMFIVRGY